jgi:hypothetical protein
MRTWKAECASLCQNPRRIQLSAPLTSIPVVTMGARHEYASPVRLTLVDVRYVEVDDSQYRKPQIVLAPRAAPKR